jgi:hypothetical protein
MSLTITKEIYIDGVLTDPSSIVLSDPTEAYGVKRDDTDAVVVADGVAMTKVSTGIYRYTFSEPASYLTYTYWIEWVYGGETYHAENSIQGQPGGYICTLNDVKGRLGISSTDHDTVITRIIAGIHNIFDSYCRHPLLLTAADVTEYYTGAGLYLQLRRYPIISITSIKEAIDYDFDAADELVEDDDYRIMNGGINGILCRIYACWPFTPDATQLIYRGGFAAADAALGENETALPDDLREAAIEQACLFFKRKDDLGLSSVSFEGGSIQKFNNLDLFPFVRDTLDRYRLISL